MENNLDDPKNIAGLSSLLNNDDLDSNMDLAELEREIANGARINVENDTNIAEQFRDEMNRISRNFDLGTNDEQESYQPSPKNTPKSTNVIPSYEAYNSPRQNHIKQLSENYDNDDEPQDVQLRNMTTEERKQKKINNVLCDIDDRDLEFSVERERDEDDKSSMLEQIDMLKTTLDDDGVDISNVPDINKSSSMKDVQNVYKILRLKNDRNRYCSFAEEIILSGAYGMEYIFDGKNIWFGRTPDLTDWSSTVKVKLRRMRFETSTFVKQVMQEYNLSSGMRLALELIPSMFLYSRSRRISQNDNLVSDGQYQSAISQMNSN